MATAASFESSGPARADLPRISIVLPVFNAADTIVRAVESLIAQDYPALELILMDGGSQDGTLEVLAPYRPHFSHFRSEPDRGQSHALNKGFELAEGEIFGWLCGDDALQPGALMHVAESFGAHPEANLLIGLSRRVYGDGSEQVLPLRPDLMERIGFHNGIDQPSAFWRATLHRRAGALDEKMHLGMDWEWWCRLRAAGARAVLSDRELSLYYFPEDSKTSAAPEGNIEAMYHVIKTYGPLEGRLADIYLYLYEKFDLKGCYDSPPTAPRLLQLRWAATLLWFYARYGRELVASYNWTWCARQARGLNWHEPRAHLSARAFLLNLMAAPGKKGQD